MSQVSWRAAAPVTVAIATRNRAGLLADALRSCENQDVRPSHVIVVDDGSTDSTAATVAQFTSIPLNYVNVGGIGLGNARNLATALCQTRYLCILDDDDIMLPNRIADHIASFVGGVQLSHGGWINVTSHLELEYRPGKRAVADTVAYIGGAIHHDACCYDAAVLREFPYRALVRGGIDFDLAVRALHGGIKTAHTGSYVLLRRRQDTSVSVQHAETQRRMRSATVSLLNMARTNADVAARTERGRNNQELSAAACPPLQDIYTLLGQPSEAMRVMGVVSRAADQLFALVSQLEVDLNQIEFVDPETSLTGTIGLACRATRDLATLSAFEAELRRYSTRMMVLTARSMAERMLTAEMKYETRPGYFRLVLRSAAWRELQLAHRIIRNQRDAIWYLAVRQESINARKQPVYYLVSAPFEYRADSGKQRHYVENWRRFIFEQTDLSPLVIEGEATG